jgi:hypothetical protein
MALMDAKEYDPRPAQRLRRLVGIAAALLIVFLVLWFWPSGRFRFWSEWNVADKFFAALERKDFDAAYGIYFADPGWKQHPEKHSAYTISQFNADWGPSGEYGPITSHHVDCTLKPKTYSTGVVVVITINNKAARSMWVEDKDKTISDSPVGTVLCSGRQ